MSSIIYGKLPLSLLSIQRDDSSLSFIAIKTFIYLSSFKKGKVYPTQETIAKMIKCKSQSTISLAIKELEAFGLLKILKSQHRKNNMYDIIYERRNNYALIDIELLKFLSFTELKIMSVLLSRERVSTILDMKYISSLLNISKNNLYKPLKSIQEKELIHIYKINKIVYYKILKHNKKETNVLAIDKNIFYIDFNKKVEEC